MRAPLRTRAREPTRAHTWQCRADKACRSPLIPCCGCWLYVAQIRVTPLTTKKLEHQGIKIQLLGQIELASERGAAHEFVSFGEA